jgi:hypothetical protein
MSVDQWRDCLLCNFAETAASFSRPPVIRWDCVVRTDEAPTLEVSIQLGEPDPQILLVTCFYLGIVKVF